MYIYNIEHSVLLILYMVRLLLSKPLFFETVGYGRESTGEVIIEN
jgi:hypothetical protein